MRGPLTCRWWQRAGLPAVGHQRWPVHLPFRRWLYVMALSRLADIPRTNAQIMAVAMKSRATGDIGAVKFYRHKCNQCDGIPLSLLPPTDRRRNCFRNGRNPSSKAAKRPRCRLQTKWTRFDHILGQYGRIVERFSRIFVSVVQYCHIWQLVAQSWLLVDACRPRPFHWLRLSTIIIVLP